MTDPSSRTLDAQPRHGARGAQTRSAGAGLLIALALLAGASAPAAAQARFPQIPLWANPGGFRDSSVYNRFRAVCSYQGLPADTFVARPRTVTVRFLRDRLAEARPDFGGYRIYRAVGKLDEAHLVLIRRFSRQPQSIPFFPDPNWNFSVVDTSRVSPNYLQFVCNGRVAGDSIVTFVDPDSNGSWQRICRTIINGRCTTPGDSVTVLVAPPGPHDGFLTWYAITYEAKNTSENSYRDLFVPDTSGNYARCWEYGNPDSCPNLNHKLANVMAQPVEPTGGPTPNLEGVGVVPNPFRAAEAWDQPGGHELHFINLPKAAHIQIYTVAGDLVIEIEHKDPVRDFERWDLKNQNGRDVASGIYLYRVVAADFTYQNRFIVIR